MRTGSWKSTVNHLQGLSRTAAPIHSKLCLEEYSKQPSDGMSLFPSAGKV